MIPRCRRHVAPALAALAVIFADATLPPLLLIPPSKLMANTRRVLKLNNSLAKEPLSTLDATKRVTRILDAKYAKADLLVDIYVPTSADSVAPCCSLLLPLMLIVGCSSSSS